MVHKVGRYAAIDGGKSALRVAVGTPDGIRYGEAPGFGYAPGQDDVAVMVAAVRQAADQVPRPVDRVCAGLTGAPGDRAERDKLRAAIGDVFGTDEVVVVGDVLLAHAGALDGPGVVICAGTGTAVLAVGADGRRAWLDAWGPLLGDRGSGWAIGSAGLRAAAAAIDRVGPATVLAARMAEVLGGTDLAALQRLYGDQRMNARIAAFAEHVAAAARNGDEVARQICVEAAGDLAATAIAAADKAGLQDGIVSWAGRVFDAGALVLDPLRKTLSAAGLRLTPPRGGALDGGLRLAASEPDSVYAPLLAGTDR